MTTSDWPEYPVSQRDDLLASQPTRLVTVRSAQQLSLCHAIDKSAGTLCPNRASFTIERYDYRTGVTMSDMFRPAKIITRVCTEHMAVLDSEGGFIDYEWLNMPDDTGPLVDVLERYFRQNAPKTDQTGESTE